MRRKRLNIIIATVLFLMLSGAVLFMAVNSIYGDFTELIGENLQALAVHVAGDIEISDTQVARLEESEYIQTMDSEVVKDIAAKIASLKTDTPIRGAYIQRLLPDTNVKYYVDKESAEFYGLDAGTPLNMMWLVDILINPDSNSTALIDSGNYYDDIYRYTNANSNEINIMTEKEPAYMLHEDEWGKVIAGLAPIYTTEGNYIGMFGVDVAIDNVTPHLRSSIINIVCVYLFATVALMLMFMYFYFKYLKIEHEKLYVDPLTNAYNRRYFTELFEKNLRPRGNSKLVVMMIDIDHFKLVNDEYGHDMGDKCLRAIALSIKSIIHEPPNVLMRYGGEEFLAAISVTSETEADNTIERILNAVRELNLFGNGKKVSVSCGACILPYADVSTTDMQFIIKCADNNLYFCKNNGRNRYKLSDYSVKG